MNQNRHFDEWLAESDYDYAMAHELYYKLEKRGNLCEVLELILESREKGEGAMGGAPSPHIYKLSETLNLILCLKMLSHCIMAHFIC